MKKQNITDGEFDAMALEAGKVSNDVVQFEQLMSELEEVLRTNRHLKPSPRMVVQRGRLMTNQGKAAEAIAIYDTAVALAIRQGNSSMHGLALRMKAANQQTAGELGAAEANLKKAIEILDGPDQKYQVAACLHTLSLVYLETADFEKYLETSEETLRVLKSSGADGIVYARGYTNTMIARCVELLNVKLYDRARIMLDELIASPELKLSGEYGYLNTMLTQGQYLTETSQYKKSNDVLLPLLDSVKDKSVNEETAAIHSYIAENMVALKKYKEAAHHIGIAMSYHREANMAPLLSENLLCYASLLIAQRKMKAADAACREAEEIMTATKSDFLLWQFHKRYAVYHEQKGDYKKAYEHIAIAQKHQAESMRADYDKRINSITYRYELKEKESENELLKKDIDMKRQELSMASDFLHQKVELLKEMKGFMRNMRKENIEKNKMIKALDMKIDSVLNVEYEQQLIIEKIAIASNDFITKIRKQYPALSLSEAKICSLMRNNFSSKDIANMLVTSVRTIENHRYNIRKKLGITGDNTLQALLLSIK